MTAPQFEEQIRLSRSLRIEQGYQDVAIMRSKLWEAVSAILFDGLLGDVEIVDNH